MQLGMTKLTDHAPASQEHCWRLGWAIKEQMVSTMDSLLEETKNIESICQQHINSERAQKGPLVAR